MQAPLNKPRILIVEDEKIVARHLELQLAELGYEPVAHASKGENAIELAASLLPDLVLMDIQLAGAMDGIEAAQIIRNQLAIPVVFLTAFSEEDIVTRAKLTEPFGYILKPFSDRDLRTIIEMALYKHKTETKLKEAAQYNQAVLDNMADAMITIDANGLIESTNIMACVMFGYTPEELIGHNISMLMPEPHHSQHDSYLQEFRRTQKNRIIGAPRELEGRRKNASIFAISLTVTQIALAGKTTFIGMISDITQRKENEAHLRDAKEAAEVANKAKSEFLASMSHEIRTPINGVLGLAQLLDETPLDAEQHQLVKTIIASGNSLMTVLNDILDFSKMEAGKMDIELSPFEPRQLVHDIMDVMNVQAKQKGIRLTLQCAKEIPLFICSDAARIRQILFNLIGNALKFTQHGSVNISLHIVQQHLRFDIQDTGVGIALEKQPVLFQMFTQENTSTSRTFGGTGLGLAIAKRLAGLLGGEIGFESEKNVGSLFWVSLPLVAVDPSLAFEEKLAPASPRQKLANEFANCRVLLVEDNDVNRMVAGGMLKSLGMAYDVALNGIEAVEKVLSSTYNLVLMDCEMPEMDGYQSTQEIRAHEQSRRSAESYRPIPIIALTANAMSHDRQRCMESGMNGFIVKPLKIDVLHAVISEHVFLEL